jgi:hypothetical protein
VDRIGRNARHEAQLHGFVGQQPHRPVVMPIGRRTARHSNQVSRLEAREGATPMLLHFMVLPHVVVDNSDFSPPRLTGHDGAPYDTEAISATDFK